MSRVKRVAKRDDRLRWISSLKPRMPRTMIEAFARGLVDKIMMEAFEVLDGNSVDGRFRETSRRADAADVELEQPRARFQVGVDRDGPEAVELSKNMARGLRDVRIGDPSSSLPIALTSLEKQVKHVARCIGEASAAEALIAQGQGDVNQIIPDVISEVPSEPREPVTTRRKKELQGTNDTTGDISLLRWVIEELETEGRLATAEENKAKEEHAEELIRTIESVEDTERIISPDDDRPESKSDADNLAPEGTETSFPLDPVSSLKNASPEKSLVEENPFPESSLGNPGTLPVSESPAIEAAQETTQPSRKKAKKKGFRSRMRKLFRAAFRRREK